MAQQYVPHYDGKLLIKKPHARHEPHLVYNPDDFTEIEAAQIQGDFVVLAANSRPNTDQLVGKAFHVSGSGMTGWVFEHGQTLRLADMSDEAERKKYPGLSWSDHYGGSVDYYHQEERKPILAMPLKIDGQIIGVFKFLGPQEKAEFSETDEKIAVIVSQVIAGVIRQNWTVREQEQAILRLAEMGAKKEPQEVVQAVTERLTRMLGCQKCELFWRDEHGAKVVLHVENGSQVNGSTPVEYPRGQDLIGWVFKTGKLLLIDDIHEYASGVELDEKRLQMISDGEMINEQDRFLRCERACQSGSNHPLPFLAAPVITDDGVVRGVLATNCLRGRSNERSKPFTRADLELVQFFARTIALSFQNDHDRRLSDLLIEMGYLSQPDQLYDLVIRRVPELMAGVY